MIRTIIQIVCCIILLCSGIAIGFILDEPKINQMQPNYYEDYLELNVSYNTLKWEVERSYLTNETGLVTRRHLVSRTR